MLELSDFAFQPLFPSSAAVGFPSHPGQTASSTFWRWGAPAPMSRTCWSCTCPILWRAGAQDTAGHMSGSC